MLEVQSPRTRRWELDWSREMEEREDLVTGLMLRQFIMCPKTSCFMRLPRPCIKMCRAFIGAIRKVPSAHRLWAEKAVGNDTLEKVCYVVCPSVPSLS